MCEKRTRKIKKGSHLTRMREARRLQRMRRSNTPSSSDDSIQSIPSPCPSVVDKTLQNRVILDLACKTMALMHKNRVIQQKVIALRKETTEFITTIMKHPENRRRYNEHVRLYGIPQRLLVQAESKQNPPLKIEPDA